MKTISCKVTILYIVTSLCFLSPFAFASTIQLSARYKTPGDDNYIGQQVKIIVPSPREMSQPLHVSHHGILKTIAVIDLANSISWALADFDQCTPNIIEPEPFEIVQIQRSFFRTPIPIFGKCPQEQRNAIAGRLATALQTIRSQKAQLEDDLSLRDTFSVIDKLVHNLQSGNAHIPFYHNRSKHRIKMAAGMSMSAAPSGTLNVTSGGAKDFGHFKKIVEQGLVPHVSEFVPEGFLSEFNLSIPDAPCNKVICVQPATMLDKERGKMFVQIGLGSNVTKDAFKRKPLNLGIVLDISGSMSDTDKTEKTRLEWAKEAIDYTLRELGPSDIISIVVFDTYSETLVTPTFVTDKESIMEKVRELKPKGSTNLDSGLRNGYKYVSSGFRPDYENRVILISDAGLNTGVVEHSIITRLVSDYASDNIGLTAIGIGENFNQDLIHGITMSKGGNYIFVNSGKELETYFGNFNYLVTPVAYSFQLSLDLGDTKAKLVNTYGILKHSKEPVASLDLINIRTLFLSEQGGAMVLEFDLQ